MKLFQDTLRKARGAQAAPARRLAPRALPPPEADARARDAPQVHEASQRASEFDVAMMMTSQERMRARCTVPRDVVQVYENLNKVGLQYGPAFRLLTDVWIPQEVADAQAKAHATRH